MAQTSLLSARSPQGLEEILLVLPLHPCIFCQYFQLIEFQQRGSLFESCDFLFRPICECERCAQCCPSWRLKLARMRLDFSRRSGQLERVLQCLDSCVKVGDVAVITQVLCTVPGGGLAEEETNVSSEASSISSCRLWPFKYVNPTSIAPRSLALSMCGIRPSQPHRTNGSRPRVRCPRQG